MDLVRRLSYLFGTEEAVNLRQQLTLMREAIRNGWNSRFHVICSGSLGEGVVYPRSDDDLMHVDKRPRHVYNSYDEATEHRALYMIPSVYSPGFCILQDTEEQQFSILSSQQCREWFVKSLPGYEEHGPCASIVSGTLEYDHAYCLQCLDWPTVALEWIVRKRKYGQPSRELIKTIVKNGCHVVPIGNPDSPLRDIEWRVSFSVAERSLIHAFSHVQFIVYNLFKLVLKKVLAVRIPNVLCSYFIKTVMFYQTENSTPELWVNSRIEECYTKCLLLLYHFINTMNCPNYFVPSNNMMRRKVNADNKVPFLVLVSELMTRGIVGSINMCGELDALSPNLSTDDCEFKEDFELLMGYLWTINKFECTYNIQKISDDDEQFQLRNFVSRIISSFQYEDEQRDITDITVFSLTLRHVLTQIGLKSARMANRATTGNKSRYQMLEYGQSMLTKGRNTDISSGRLHLANFMLMIGNFQHSLTILQSILSKYAPNIMSEESAVASMIMYKETVCNKGYSLLNKSCTGWALDGEYSPSCSELAPFPVRMLLVMTKRIIMIPPVVCAYFLQGLCFYHTNNTTSLGISVKSLEDSVNAIPSDYPLSIFYGRLLLGHMTMLQHDYHSSCRWLMSAYLCPQKQKLLRKHQVLQSEFANVCVTLLACLLNRLNNSK